MGAPAITTLDLTKFYGPDRGVEALDLSIGRGEVFGFLGPNGAGKTTAIRLLLDLIRPTRGRATIAGLDVRRDSLEVRRRVGYLPGELRLPASATGRRFLTHVTRLRDGCGAERVGPLAERLGLDLDRRIADLSKGNKQKVGIVAAFAPDPEVLLLDEPASGLDPLRQEDVQDLIRERADAGSTVFLSSHALDQVERVADSVGIIDEGRLIAVESVAALKLRARRKVEVRLSGPAPANGLAHLPGVRLIERSNGVVRLEVEGSMDALIKRLAELPVETLTSEEPDLEDVFLSYYGRADEG